MAMYWLGMGKLCKLDKVPVQIILIACSIGTVPFSEVKPSKPVDKVHKQVEDQSHQPHGPVRRLPPIRKSLTPRQKRKAVSLAVISNEGETL